MEDFVKGTLCLIAAVIVGVIGLKVAWWLLCLLWWFLRLLWIIVRAPFTAAFWTELFEASCACAYGLVAGIGAYILVLALVKLFSRVNRWM